MRRGLRSHPISRRRRAIVLFGTIFGERLLYLPSIFLLIALALAVRNVSWKILVPILAIVMSLSLVRLETYLWRWNNREDFYRYCLEVQPRSVKLHVLLSDEFLARGDDAAAAGTMADALKIAPNSWEAWYLAGVIADRRHDYRYALECFGKSQKLSPDPTTANQIQRLTKMLRAPPSTRS